MRVNDKAKNENSVVSVTCMSKTGSIGIFFLSVDKFDTKLVFEQSQLKD